jgi:uncharacterized protein DUF5681
VEVLEKPKKKPRGKPFPKGLSGNPGGKFQGRLTQMGDDFVRELFKPVDAQVNGKPVRTTQHALFIQQLIKAGITGNTPARKLLLDFMRENEIREKIIATELATKQASGSVAIDWGAEQGSVYQDVLSKLKSAAKR